MSEAELVLNTLFGEDNIVPRRFGWGWRDGRGRLHVNQVELMSYEEVEAILDGPRELEYFCALHSTWDVEHRVLRVIYFDKFIEENMDNRFWGLA